MAADIVDKAKNEASEIRTATEQSVFESLSEIDTAKEEIENLKRNLNDMSRICENRIRTVELNLGSTRDAIKTISKTGSKPIEKTVAAEGTEGEQNSEKDFF